MDEELFLAAMVADPANVDQRLVMADWLEERDPARAELMRIQEQLRRIETRQRKKAVARMQQLLRDGVQPVVPRMTNSLGMRFVFIFPGEFLMGERAYRRPEQIKEGFWLGETVVTQEQWQSVMQTEPWKGEAYIAQHPDCPATCVSWAEATEFCDQLSERENAIGNQYILPAEAQWEYACRAGTTSGFSFGDDEAELGQYAWFAGDAGPADEAYAHPVGQKLQNPWGLFDMHGNVWEWRQGHRGRSRVMHGGSAGDSAQFARSAARVACDPSYRNRLVGFRCAQVPSSQSSNKPESGAKNERR